MSEDTADMPELEPMEEAAAAPEAAATAPAQRPKGLPGLAPPAFNPTADKEYYRFFFAGVVMFLGCMMPFGPEWDMNGYKTLSGAFFTLISLGMIWSWWSAIHTARFSGSNLKWVGLALLPFLIQVLNLIGAFDEPAVRDWIADESRNMPSNWDELMSALGSINTPEGSERFGNFVRAFGAGKIVLLFGSLLAEIFMIMAVMGGAKTAKAQKAAKMAERSSRGGGKGRRR